MTEEGNTLADEPPARKAGGSARYMSRQTANALIVLLVVILAIAAFVYTRPAGEPLLPDLAMAIPDEHSIGVSDDGRTLLLFSAMVVNIGDGPWLVDGEFDPRSQVWTVRHLVQYSGWGTEKRSIDADVGFGGDGHEHLHILHPVRYRLVPLERTSAIREPQRLDEKVGFCLFDRDEVRLDLPNAPQQPVYDTVGCGNAGTIAFSMGLSVGWGDNYFWHLPGQDIDITGIPDGRYRLYISADPSGWFEETNEGNNEAWSDLEIILSGEEPVLRVLESQTEMDG